jgi:5-methylcytosine-specific restriction endonuclease McrA
VSGRNVRDGQGHRAYRRKQAALRRRTRTEQIPCWLCGEQIDTTLPATHRMSFTADHYVALNNGGHLLRNDLRPAHRSCNSRRGDAADAEIWEAS